VNAEGRSGGSRRVPPAAGPLAVTLAAVSLFAAEAPPAPQRGEAVAVTVEKAPALDGTLEGPLWAECPPWPMGPCTSTEAPTFETWAKVLFGPTHAYVGVYCGEPDTDGLRMQHTKRDAPTWADDSVEIFLRPDPAKPYCQFVVNPRGALYDARDREAAWNSGAVAKAAIQPGTAWTVTVAIPLKDLPTFVGDGQAWTMNLCRTRPARAGEKPLMYSWAVLSETDYHAASEFGLVTGIDVPKRPDGVTRVRPGGLPQPMPRNRGEEAGGVTVYRRIDFDAGRGGWGADGGAEVALTDDAVHGRALRVDCREGWAGCRLPVSIVGSRDLKLVAVMKGRHLDSAGINAYDIAARDNTTAYGYRYIEADRFTPMLYRLDRFRYNSATSGFVSPGTHYGHVRFYGPSDVEPGTWFAMDNVVIYRGEDRRPPAKVTGLTAAATDRGVHLAWDPADDNVTPTVYVIARSDGGAFRKVAESCSTSHLDAAAGRGVRRYRVFAVDAEENVGPWSDAVSVRSTAAPRKADLSREVRDRLGYADDVRRVHDRGKGKVRRNHATLFGDSLTGATVYPQCARAAFGTLSVSAFGYPAQRTGFARGKVQEILEREHPEFMFILYGTNNNKAEAHLSAAMEDLAAVVEACEARGTVAVLGTIPPRGWEAASAPEAEFNRRLIALCRERKIPTGYIFEAFQAAGPENRRTYLGGDGVHWTGEGMALAARAWGRVLDQIRFVLRDRE
jgi:hypothetical protein